MTVQPEETGQNLVDVFKNMVGRYKDIRIRLSLVIPSESTRVKIETQKIPFKHKKKPVLLSGWSNTGAVCQRGCGVFILRNI